MSEESARAEARLAAMQRDEALNTLAAVRRELTAALQEHRANELHLAASIRATETQLAQARDTIGHMERSLFWRVRQWVVRLRGGR
jgi:small-conductance mechanosensitive channel